MREEEKHKWKIEKERKKGTKIITIRRTCEITITTWKVKMVSAVQLKRKNKWCYQNIDNNTYDNKMNNKKSNNRHNNNINTCQQQQQR